MVFWLAVFAGGLFAWIAVQIGFYATWILLFHLVLSAYMAVFLTPVVLASLPAATSTPYGYALTFVCIAVATLSIVYGICFACLTGRLRVEFPKLFDTIVAGVLGFEAGFLVLSFVTFAFCLTPLSDTAFFKNLGFNAESQRTNIRYLCWWCDMVHSFVSSPDAPPNSKQVVDTLLEKVAALSAKNAKPDNEPSKPAGPQTPTTTPPPPPVANQTNPFEVDQTRGNALGSAPSGKDAPKPDAKNASGP